MCACVWLCDVVCVSVCFCVFVCVCVCGCVCVCVCVWVCIHNVTAVQYTIVLRVLICTGSHLYQPPIFHFKVNHEPAKIFLHEIEVKGLVKLMAHFYRFRLLAGGW